MPTFSLVEIAKILFKVGIVVILFGLFYNFVVSFVDLLFSVLGSIDGIANTINNLDLGWGASALGLVDFLNALMSSFYIAISILLSGTVTILGFKHGSKFFKMLLSF